MLDTKFNIVIIIASFSTIAISGSITNFVSAATECFGNSGLGYFICTSPVSFPNGQEKTFVMQCSFKDKEKGTWDCQTLGAAGKPPGLEEAVKRAVNAQVFR